MSSLTTGPVLSSVAPSTRSLSDWLSDTGRNVKAYGATGNGSTDDTTAIQNAVTAGGLVYFPPGTYLVSSTITINTSFTRLVGAGAGVTKILVSGSNDVFVFTPSDPSSAKIYTTGLVGMTIERSTEVSAGTAVRLVRCSGFFMRDYDLRYHVGGIDIEGGDGHYVSDGQITTDVGWTSFKSGSFMVKLRNAIYGAVREKPSEIFFDTFNWKASNGTGYQDQSIVIRAVDGVFFTNGHVGFAGTDCMDIALESATDAIISVESSNVYFDASFVSTNVLRVRELPSVTPTSGVISDLRFVGCMLSLAQGDGIVFTSTVTRYVRFSGCTIFRNVGWGAVLTDIQEIGFSDCAFVENDRGGTATSGGGVLINGTSKNVKISACQIGSFAGTSPRMGIEVDGNADKIMVLGCAFNGNVADVLTSNTTNLIFGNIVFAECISDISPNVINRGGLLGVRRGNALKPSIAFPEQSGLFQPVNDAISYSVSGLEAFRCWRDPLAGTADQTLDIKIEVGKITLDNRPISPASKGYLALNTLVQFPNYTVAGLPTGIAGMVAFATNGRKNGEGAGAGTGVLVFNDGTAWRACDTGATVAA